MSKKERLVLAYDLGGTKVAVGVLNSRGKVLDSVRVPAVFEQGKDAVIEQLFFEGKQFLAKFPEVEAVGIASAGPLDPSRGILLDPTNFARAGKRWGEVPITSILKKRFKLPVFLDNDAAAAILAEHWVGAAKGYDNVMILTLGTGLGTGIITNGELVRAGRMLHPEAGHLILRAGDRTALCGCGNYGCAEAFLSGNGFGKRARFLLKRKDLTAVEVAELARKNNRAAKKLFKEYAELMAIAIHNYVTIYAPEVVVFTGSFAHASDLFLEQTKKLLPPLLKHLSGGVDIMPKLLLSTLDNHAGLVGGGVVALRGLKTH